MDRVLAELDEWKEKNSEYAISSLNVDEANFCVSCEVGPEKLLFQMFFSAESWTPMVCFPGLFLDSLCF